MEAEYFPPKEDVILQNETPTDLYILVSGAVDLIAKVDGHDQVLGKAVTGEIFGEIAVLCGRPQPFTVRTTEVSQLLRLNRTALMNMLQANAEDKHVTLDNLFQKFKGSGSLGYTEQQTDGLVHSDWLHGGPKGATQMHAGHENTLHANLETLNMVDCNIRSSEAMKEKQLGYCCDSSKYGENMELTDDDGQTAPIKAVCEGHLEMVKILLERGICVNKQDATALTPIALAEQEANKRIYGLSSSNKNREKPDEHKMELLVPEKAKITGIGPFKPTKIRPPNCPKLFHRNPIDISSSNIKCLSHSDITEFTRKRVTLYMKIQQHNTGQKLLGKLILLPDSVEEVLRIAGDKFGGQNFTKVQNAEDAEIEDVNVIRDGDHLFFSS